MTKTDWPKIIFNSVCSMQVPLPLPNQSFMRLAFRIKHPSVVIVGDNLDKSVNPRHMTIEHQWKSLHYFDSYAVFNRIDFSDLASDKPIADISTLTLSTYPTQQIVPRCVKIMLSFLREWLWRSCCTSEYFMIVLLTTPTTCILPKWKKSQLWWVKQ